LNVTVFVELGAYKRVDSENVLNWGRETIVRWLFIVDGKDRHVKLFRPKSSIILHCAAGKSHKSTTMCVNDYLLEIGYGLITHTAAFLLVLPKDNRPV
jgi:hypothetical protein